MDTKDRIQEYLDAKGIKTATFERDCGMSNGYWRKTKSISANIVSIILRTYSDLSSRWVLFGEGSMFCPTETKDINKFFDDDDKKTRETEELINDSVGHIKEQMTLQKENAMLKELLAEKDQRLEEKERTILAQSQTIEVLLSQRNDKP